VARIGGEEFCALLPETDAGGAASLAERMRAGVAALGIPHGMSRAGANVTASLGAASIIPATGMSRVELLAAADAALYRAKREGRNRVCVAGAGEWALAGAAEAPRGSCGEEAVEPAVRRSGPLVAAKLVSRYLE
jgi:two-component system chemotaxis family response regulator WspR